MQILNFEEKATQLSFLKELKSCSKELTKNFQELTENFNSFAETDLVNGVMGAMCKELAQLPEYAIHLLVFKVTGNSGGMTISIGSTLVDNLPFFSVSSLRCEEALVDCEFSDFQLELTKYLEDKIQVGDATLKYGDIPWPYFSVLCGVYTWLNSLTCRMQIKRSGSIFEFQFQQNISEIGMPYYETVGYAVIDLNIAAMKQHVMAEQKFFEKGD